MAKGAISMLYDEQLEGKLKERLQNLRKNKGLTQGTLVEAINNKYPDLYEKAELSDLISEGTIKQYESQKGKTSGMSIGTLCMLADFYEVSVEYLLGITNFKSPDIEHKAIHEKLKLSDRAITSLERMTHNGTDTNDTLNYVLSDPDFSILLIEITDLLIVYAGAEDYLKHYNSLTSEQRVEQMRKTEKETFQNFKEARARGEYPGLELGLVQYRDFQTQKVRDRIGQVFQNVVNGLIKGKAADIAMHQRKDEYV
jgi:transcriptional regulator with XRE-family HTH domain